MSDPETPDLDEAVLKDLFAEAKAEATPSNALMSRIVADAEAARQEAPPAPRASVWRQMLDGLGGWPSLSGLATATIAGVYIGLSDPTILDTVGLTEISGVSSDVLPGDNAFFEDALVEEG